MGRFLLFVLAVVVLATSSVAVGKPPLKWQTVVVKDGDSLGRIGKRYNVRVRYLRRNNRLKKGDMLRPGQVLRVRRSVVNLRRKKMSAKRQHRRPKTKSNKKWVMHVVKKGDNLWKIADQYDVSLTRLIRNNNFAKRPRIYPGDRIRVRVGRKNYISKAVQLRGNGKGYIRMRPKKSWGTPGTIRLLTEVYAEMAKRYPNGPSGYIADISRKRGGPLKPHKSHQRGVDIDLSYYKVNAQPTRGLEVMTAETLDIGKNWELIRLFINTGHIKVIFMDYKLQALLYKHLVKLGYDKKTIAGIVQYPSKKNRRARVRHSSGHHHHLHVRFDCTRPNSPCKRPRTALIADPPLQRRLAEIETTPRRVTPVLVQPKVSAQSVAKAVPVVKAQPVVKAVPVVKAGLEAKTRPTAKDELLGQLLPALAALPTLSLPIPVVSRRKLDSSGTRRAGRAAIETSYEKVDWMAVFRTNLKRPQDIRKAGARARQQVSVRASERPRRMSRLGLSQKSEQ